MVRRTQLLYPQSVAHFHESTLNQVEQSQSIPRKGMFGQQSKTFTEKDSAYGELALIQGIGNLEINDQHETEQNSKMEQINSKGRTSFTLHSLDWQSIAPVQLTKNVQRLTAPNPSIMTGPGTNSYIVGTPDCGFIVIDPGPLDNEHTQRIYKACAGDIRMIICTHSHPDHSPGALPLKNLCKAASNSNPPVLGLSSLPSARAHSEFKPERELYDSERLTLKASSGSSSSDQHTLRVVHTPGHAANHLCLVLEEDGLLFSGDHILNGSTTIVDPPDGHMGDYLNSLEKLIQICGDERIEFILPAHGYVIGNFWARPRSAIDVAKGLHQHRLTREEKIYQTIQNNLSGTMQDWVQKAYDDVPSSIWPIAMRSLLAHVEHLKQTGRISSNIKL